MIYRLTVLLYVVFNMACYDHTSDYSKIILFNGFTTCRDDVIFIA